MLLAAEPSPRNSPPSPLPSGTAESTPASAPADLLALVLGLTGAWFTASEALRTYDSNNPWSRKRLAQFRAAAVQAATRILAGAPPPPGNADGFAVT